jgi:hypothetical protein
MVEAGGNRGCIIKRDDSPEQVGAGSQAGMTLKTFSVKFNCAGYNGAMLVQQDMKQAVLSALEANDLDAIERFALRGRKILSVLVRIAYDKETLVGRRAIAATGRVASVFIRNNYEFLRETVRKLLWSLTDESGGIGWSAPELLGEIVSAGPEEFSDVVPIIAGVFSIEEEVFRPGILYAFKRIAESHPDMISPYQDIILRGLSESSPEARIHALDLVRTLGERIDPAKLSAIACKVRNMLQDRAEAWLYKNDGFINIEVGSAAREVNKYFKDQFGLQDN